MFLAISHGKSPKIELGRVTEAPTRQIHPADRRRGMGVNLAGRGLSERPQRDLGGNFRWPTRPGRPAERRSEALINWVVGGWWWWLRSKITKNRL